jgi:branched-chain amino acid transport system permease protein
MNSYRLNLSPEAQRNLMTVAVLLSFLVVPLLVMTASGPDCALGDRSCHSVIQLTLNGLLVGGVYALVALGIVVINKASGIFNFAHGYMMLAGALLFWQGFIEIPSHQFSILVAASGGFLALILVGIPPEKINTELKQSLLVRLQQRVMSRQFALGALAALVAGIIVYLLLQNLKNDILRGTLSAVIGGAVMGLGIERFAIRPLIGQPLLTAIMMTLAVALLVQGMTSLFWGTQPHALSVFVEPPTELLTQYPIGVDAEGNTIYQSFVNVLPARAQPNYKLDTVDLLGAELSFARNLVWGFVIAILCFIAFVLFFQFTATGLAMRAVAENQVLAESVGLRVRTILAVAWAIAAIMAMIAGVIQGTGPGVGVSVLVIPSLAFRAFPAVLLGGLESIGGALVGGLIIGVVEVLVIGLVDSSTGQELAPFLVLLIALMIRPDGLFGQRRIDRV